MPSIYAAPLVHGILSVWERRWLLAAWDATQDSTGSCFGLSELELGSVGGIDTHTYVRQGLERELALNNRVDAGNR